MLGGEGSCAYAAWPEYDEALCAENVVTMGVQVNGKVKSQLTLPKDADADKAPAGAAKSQSPRWERQAVAAAVCLPPVIAEHAVDQDDG